MLRGPQRVNHLLSILELSLPILDCIVKLLILSGHDVRRKTADGVSTVSIGSIGRLEALAPRLIPVALGIVVMRLLCVIVVPLLCI